jgi:hypothetical protein
MAGERHGGGGRPLLGGRYMLGLAAVLFANIVFTVVDLVTSFVALNEGFVEGNPLLSGVSGALSLRTIGSLLVTKAIFIGGASMLALVGAKSKDRTTKKVMFLSLAVFVVLFAYVSLNNLYWLLS